MLSSQITHLKAIQLNNVAIKGADPRTTIENLHILLTSQKFNY